MKCFIRRIFVAAIIIVIWFVIAEGVNPLFIPGPDLVLRGIISLFDSGQLSAGIIFSFKRVTMASIFSGGLALVFGLFIYSIKYIRELLYPIVKTMRYIPVTAFYPLLIMWCGIGEIMKITFLILVTFVSMMPAVVLALNNVNPDLVDTGKTLGMNRIQVILMVVLPDAMPSIFENFALLISIGWTYVPFVETINAKYGLGYIIHQSSSRGRTDLVFASIAMIMIISVICDKLAGFIGAKMFKWRYLKQDD